MRPLTVRGVACALAIGTLGCQSLVDDYSADLELRTPIESSHLCEVERERFAFQVDLEDMGDLGDLVLYYEEQNQPFLEHITGLVAAFRAGDPGASVTYLSGAAGVGKSFLLRGLPVLDDDEQCEVDLDALFVETPDELDFDVGELTDLETLTGEVAFNDLPTIEDPDEFSLESLLRTGGCYVDDALVPMVFVDGIDEVHDETARLVLQSVDEFLLSRDEDDGFVHFLIAGRPEGFLPWFADSDRNERNNMLLERFDLTTPKYDSAGDIDFRAIEYWKFAQLDEALRQDGVLDDYHENVRQALATHPSLTYTLGNLAFGNFVIDHAGPGEEVGEEELKIGVFDDILLRNADSHGRPGTDSEYNSAYRRALEEVAVRYTEVSASGVFTVRSEDVVEVPGDDGESLGEVPVRTLLNHSGIAFLTTTASATRYRFDPFWVHGHLIERYNQRKFPGYRYRGCD